MEFDQGGAAVEHAHGPSDTMSTTNDGPSNPSSQLPSAEEPQKRNTDHDCHDSLVTVRLSEPPSLHVDTSVPPNTLPSRKSLYESDDTPTDVVAPTADEDSGQEELPANTPAPEPAPSPQGELEADNEEVATVEEVKGDGDRPQTPNSRQSVESEDVNWEQLQKSEDQESKDQDSDNNTALLLARLEQENNRLATNPKSVKVKVIEKKNSPSRRPRPPSMAQLRQMVHGPTPPALRYSMLPPPPMTDLEFYMALVKDYQQTAARLPTLLSNKIRKGIPPPLRGVVWQSMSGAHDSMLEDMFDRLSGESSPYEGLIGKDLGRSFPGVDMFRDPDGDGQRMLGQVLKCFSLYDTKIGYCQGLAFLVGPLVMHMPEKQAFCVLVKLMESYNLRHCFVPDLTGLHVRIYQFRELLRQQLPTLSTHLDDLQVDPAYVSQWFLSFFAVTCPLPMLFRIYDVVFAEGASETIMRVALSLMRKNQARIMACTEMEDVMQLLLSRGLWDCYHYNADAFVQDFVALSDAVTRERLATLEQGYRETQISSAKISDGARVSEVTTAASRFLGRLWASSSTPRLASFALPGTLSPGLVAPSRPLSILRRSTSKQSLASTLNSMEVASSTTSSAASVLSSASTEATSISRDSSSVDESSARESAPSLRGPNSNKSTVAPVANTSKDDNRYLHSQIEDLLTALSELQRDHALLASRLQKEREERDEDKKAVRSLLDGLRKKASTETVTMAHSGESEETITGVNPPDDAPVNTPDEEYGWDKPTAEQLSSLLDVVESRFNEDAGSRRSSIPQTKAQLRDELARAKEQLSNELAKTQDCNRRMYEMEQEVSAVKDQLRESHTHVRHLHQEKQRLERQIHTMRARASDTPSSAADGGDWFPKASGIGGVSSVPAPGGGLRELKLGRSKSTPSQAPSQTSRPFNKRASSLMMQKPGVTESEAAPPTVPPTGSAPGSAPALAAEQEALVLELIQAKTAEAIAREEAEEVKQKLESLRKAFGLGPGDTVPQPGVTTTTHRSTSSGQATLGAPTAIGMFGRLAGSPAATSSDTLVRPPAAPSPASAPVAGSSGGGGGGFWGWRR